jgi:inhibitor of KinA sporulation pathway (predicted exonuclease)
VGNIRTDKTLCLDLELTCWEGGTPPPGMVSEIIQVGIVEVDNRKLEISRKGMYYVKPVTSTVSEYCTALTGITQRTVDKQGRPFESVLRTIQKIFGPSNKMCLAWGNDDLAIADAREWEPIASPFNFVDLAHQFTRDMGLEKTPSLQAALWIMGKAFSGRAHDALIDAENLAELHLRMMRRLRGLPIPVPREVYPRPVGGMIDLPGEPQLCTLGQRA